MSGAQSRDVEQDRFKSLLENSLTVFRWAPRILLTILVISLLFYVGYRLQSLGFGPRPIESAVQFIRKALEFLYRPAEPTAAHVLALAVTCILMSTLLDWRWALSYLATIIIVPVTAAFLLAPIAGLFSVQPATSGHVVSNLLALGLAKMLEVNHVFYMLIVGWVRLQPHTFITLMMAMSVLGALVMYVDKRLAKTGGRRMAEKDLLRYALAGGGLGIIIGALLFRHKTRHYWLLAQTSIVTLTTVYVLSSTGWL